MNKPTLIYQPVTVVAVKNGWVSDYTVNGYILKDYPHLAVTPNLPGLDGFVITHRPTGLIVHGGFGSLDANLWALREIVIESEAQGMNWAGLEDAIMAQQDKARRAIQRAVDGISSGLWRAYAC